jgi:hypothetical protein
MDGGILNFLLKKNESKESITSMRSLYDEGELLSSPDKVKGTDRLAPAFVIATELTWDIVKSLGWEPCFYNDDDEFNKFYLKHCNDLHWESKNI